MRSILQVSCVAASSAEEGPSDWQAMSSRTSTAARHGNRVAHDIALVSAANEFREEDFPELAPR